MLHLEIFEARGAHLHVGTVCQVRTTKNACFCKYVRRAGLPTVTE